MAQCSRRAIFIFILMALFLCFEMALQVSPVVMTKDLSLSLKLNSFDLGVMSGVYFITYSLMQIPSGLMYDRLNIVKVVTSAILICGIGAGLFSLSESMLTGSLARMMMGFGSAFAFLSVLTVASRYFPAQYFAMLAGIAQLLAALGAIGGELPIVWLNQHLGWRHSFLLLMAFAFMLIFFIFYAFRHMPMRCKTPETSEHVRSSLKEILRKRQTWLIGAYALLNWAPITAFASLWGVPFLMTKYALSLNMAASLCSLIWLGVGLSSPFIGALSDLASQRKLLLTLTPLLGGFAFSALLYSNHLSILFLGALLFIAGLGSSGQVLSFAVVKDVAHKDRTSAAIGFNNMAVVASGMIMQPLIGKLLEMHHPAIGGDYSLAAFSQSLWLLPFCDFLCMLIAIFFIRETYPQQKGSR